MTEYVLARLGKKDPLTPSFNEASEKLKANKDIKIVDSFSYPNGAAILIEASDTAIEDVKKALPGWTIGRNQTYWGADF